MTKKQLAKEIIERLKKAYPDAGCTLDYDDAWKLLVSVRLAAQCTDARVNVVVEGLYEKYPSVEALAAADVDDIEAAWEAVRAAGYPTREEAIRTLPFWERGVRFFNIQGPNGETVEFGQILK